MNTPNRTHDGRFAEALRGEVDMTLGDNETTAASLQGGDRVIFEGHVREVVSATPADDQGVVQVRFLLPARALTAQTHRHMTIPLRADRVLPFDDSHPGRE